jgi:hypothetical protein
MRGEPFEAKKVSWPSQASAFRLRPRLTRACPLFPSDVLREDGGARWSKMTLLGTGFGDRFEVFRGGSRRFEEGLQRAEELAVLQGKRISTRRSLPCSRSTNPPW